MKTKECYERHTKCNGNFCKLEAAKITKADALRSRMLKTVENFAIKQNETYRLALLEVDTLLTNYLVAGKFPVGSDCSEVLEIVRKALNTTSTIPTPERVLPDVDQIQQW